MSHNFFIQPTLVLGNKSLSLLKRFTLMAVVLVISVGNVFAQASFETIDGLRYLLDSDNKTATVVASSGDKYSGDIVVPEKVTASDGNEYPVTVLGDNAFYCCSGLTSITIPNSVTNIGVAVFEACHCLTSVTIPNSVTSLGNFAFSCCTGLTSVTIPNSVTSLGEYAFFGCTCLTNLTISNSVTSIGDYAFSDCTCLTSLAIPSSVTSIGNYAFNGCTGLTSITIPSSVTSIGDYVFCGCNSLTSITIPNSVTSIGGYAFGECNGLTNITIPNSVTSIGYGAFYNCTGLTSIIIPSSITFLGEGCFQECSKLEQVTFEGSCPDNTISSGLQTNCIIYVPSAYLQDYKDALGSKYPYIYAAKEDQGDEKVKACATPTITYADGELQFVSTTEGAEYHYSIADADITTEKFSEDGKVQLSAAYEITVYATADGYQKSDKVTATLYWLKTTATLDGTTSINLNQVKTRGIVASSHNGIITISGLDNGEEVRFYAVDGKQIGKTRAIEGVASQAVSAASSPVVAKISGQAIKIAVK